LFFVFFAYLNGVAQVAINTTGAVPNASSMLDVTSTNTGILIPRIALTATNAAGPVTAPATSLLVYNTATAGASPNNVTPGYYYWNGTAWVRLYSGGGNAWDLLGNTGTVSSTNFLGTIDAQDLVIRTNNAENVRVTSGGLVGIGINAPSHKLTIQSGTISNTRLIGPGSFGSTARLNFGDGNYVYIDEDADDYMTIYGANRIALMGGNVGIGLTNPAYDLEINGSFGFGDGTAGSYRSRTETRNDAGQMATQSGFFQTSAPSPAANWPTGAGSWWHLIDCRHSNNANNYALQIAGSFWGNDLYYRKTADNPAAPWKMFVSTNNAGNSGQILVSQGAGNTPAWTNPTAVMVYGNNAQSIKLTNCVSTNSTTFVDIPGMSITMNTQHNTVYVFASFTARLDNGSCSAAQYGQAIAFAQLVVDGVPQAIAGQIITDYDDVNGVTTTGTISFNGIPVTITPGSHTIKIQWRRSWLWATGPAYILINPASGVGDHCVLTIFD
jgi:hypothetical protein